MDPKALSIINPQVATSFYFRSLIVIKNRNAKIKSPSSAVTTFVSVSNQHDHMFCSPQGTFTLPQ